MELYEQIAEGEIVDMRRPCPKCGEARGRLSPRQGQACCFCLKCGAWVYNVPKHELGLKPEPIRDDNLAPSVRYKVLERANFRCEFCGADAAEGVMHVAHLLSQKDIREAGLPLKSANDFDNLAASCDACNLGMGGKSIPLHQYLVFQWKRRIKQGATHDAGDPER